jgi:uncharacterized protein YaaQ
MTAKKSTLAQSLATAAGKPQPATAAATPAAATRGAAKSGGTVLIGGHYDPAVRRVLKLIEAETGKRMKPLLGEAINDLAAKYGKPQPYAGEE